MNPLIKLKKTAPLLLITLTLHCFALLPQAQAVVPPPDGGYPGNNTAEGDFALFSLTTGFENTAVGFAALGSNLVGSANTANGFGALVSNRTGSNNTANGDTALFGNTTGNNNTANGVQALFSNTTGSNNTANGVQALFINTTGSNNTAHGTGALFSNTIGINNTANGVDALFSNTTGNSNTAIGDGALIFNITGSSNTALGIGAGLNATTGVNNVYIGAGVAGVAGESNTCYIASIFGRTSADGVPVLINSANKLGTTTSSQRFKQEIKPMDKASEALFSLKPVSFRYKKEIDPAGTSQLGLVAEDVQKVNPALVVRDKDGKPYSVRYDQVNAMLLNEFLKEHRKVEKLESTLSTVNERLAEQDAKIQKVSARVELSGPAPQTAVNER